MKIGGLQKVSFIDFPGKIAAVVFTQGCPWRCQFCHNPALVKHECFEKSIPEEKIWEFVESRKKQLDGVVVSGGEPTLQPDLTGFLKRARELGFALKLDTNGVFPERLEPILKDKLVDYVAMDLKAQWEQYETVVGVSINIKDLKRSIELIRASGIPYEWRTTVACELPIDPVAISQYIQKGEKYFLQAFRSGPQTNNPKLVKSPTPDEKETIEQKIRSRGILAGWR